VSEEESDVEEESESDSDPESSTYEDFGEDDE
jgi:hypothetical protein